MYKSRITFGLSILLLVSMIWSPFLLSISMIALLLTSLVQIDQRGIRLDPAFLKGLRQLFKTPAFAVIPLSFLIVLASFWQTYDWTYWWIRMQIKLPFLVLPFAFLALPSFRIRDLQVLFYILLIFFTLCNLLILYYFLIDAELTIELMKKGKPMWTPRNHIRYSLMLAWTVIGGVYLIKTGYFWRQTWERLIIVGLTLFCFLFIHFLSVKSGILILYIGLFSWIVHYIIQSRQLVYGVFILAALFVLPLLAYQFLPTLQRKIAYTIHDFKMYKEGKGGDYSDAGRIASLHAGIQVGLKAPILGVGAGNLRREIHQYFEDNYPDYYEKLMPQNQFLFVWAGTGVWGLGLFLLAFFFPLFHRAHYEQELFLVFYVMQLFTIMIEQALENAVGIAHYLFFLLLFLQMFKTKSFK